MPDFDSAKAHQFFSAHCFNSAWELIDKPERTPEENEQMIQRTMASLWHWTQRVVEIGCRRYTRLLHNLAPIPIHNGNLGAGFFRA